MGLPMHFLFRSIDVRLGTVALLCLCKERWCRQARFRLSCFSRCLERAGMLGSLLLHTKENLHFLSLLAPQETQSLGFRLAWTKLPDHQVECNAHAAKLDQSGIVCHAAALTGRRHVSLRKGVSNPNTAILLHNSAACLHPACIQQECMPLKNNATHLFTVHCQQTPTVSAAATAWKAKV